MKKLLALLILLLCCAHLQAQQYWFGGPFSKPPVIDFAGAGDVQSAPKLKCGKYQHVYHVDAYTGGAPCSGGPEAVMCVSIAVYHPEVNECVDDMHVVTERDWQELRQRLQLLEGKQAK